MKKNMHKKSVLPAALAVTALVIILALVAIFALSTCQIYDGPPHDDGTPAPPNHVGTFICDDGVMTFSGDGKTLKIKPGKKLAELTGMPEGESDASYTFFANLPPHHVDYRYDKADELEITVEGKQYSFHNCMGDTTSDKVCFYIYDANDERVNFEFIKK